MWRLYAIIGGSILLILAGLIAITITWIAPHIPYRQYEMAFLAFVDEWRLVRYDIRHDAYIFLGNTPGIVSFDWSPDGQQLVLVIDNQLMTMDVETGEIQLLYAGEDDDYFLPQWSPDGEYIAFFGSTGDMFDDIKPLRRGYILRDESLIEIPNVSHFLTWLPDSTHVAYVDENLLGNITVFNIETQEKTTISLAITGGNLNWLSDGRLVFWQAFTTTGIEIYDLQRGVILAFVTHPDYNYLSPNVLPDGDRIVVLASDFRYDGSQLHILDMDGNLRQRITQFEYVAYPRWRP